ncbi:MAG TPA: RDD family protein [Candidatus Baltobacteraceae bacterium]|nr:RDD family protein [Candidatus Baltobacteraceae bacterium]
MPSPLFTGATSLRDPRERLTFVVTLLFAFPAAALLGFFIHERIGLSEVALFIVVAMIYVTLARGRLIGSSVMIHQAQFPRVFAIVKHACATLEIPMPLIFAREDYNVPVAALGFGEPYALVLSSHWIEHLEDDELAFIVGRQLGHIAAGHTRYLSLLSVNGNENPIISLIFGAWLRTCEFTCDKVGLLVCGSLDAAARAIAISSFHHFGRSVNVAQFAEQGREIARDSVLKWGEWLGAEPYATRRIEHMERFSKSAQFALAEEWFLREVGPEPPALREPGALHVERTDCAGWWRRFAAVAIDLVIISALLGAFTGQEPKAVAVSSSAQPSTSAGAAKTKAASANDDDSSGAFFSVAGVSVGMGGISFAKSTTAPARTLRAIGEYIGVGRGSPFWLGAIYLALLVSIAGQSFGMMIAGLRVVSTDFRPAGFWKVAWRYALVLTLWPVILAVSPVTRRVMLHDRFSGTRLITAERVMARVFTPAA